MPLESATYISDLVITNPANTDGLGAGDDHIRLIKAVEKNTFPNITGAVTGTQGQLNAASTAFSGTAGITVLPAGAASAEADLKGIATSGRVQFKNTATNGTVGALTVAMTDATDANSTVAATLTRAGALAATTSLNAPSILKGGNELIPVGIICLWHGSTASIPAGWALCNGSNGTPDLRNAFIVAAGDVYSVAQTGGATTPAGATSTAGAHTHTGHTGAAGAYTPLAASDSQGSHSHGGATAAHALTTGELPSHAHEQQAAGAGGGNEWPIIGTAGTGGSGAISDAGIATTSVGSNIGHMHDIVGDGGHTHNINVAAIPDHTHTVDSDGNHSHTFSFDNRPVFYALAYIMKTT